MNYLIIYITENCTACSRVVASAKEVSKELTNIKVQVKKITELDGNFIISPAVFLNNKLFCYGEIDTERLIEALDIVLQPKC